MDPISAKHALDVDFDRDAFFVNRNAGLIAKLGSRTLYWEVFNPIAFEESQVPADQEATLGSLVDDFADIHRDLVVELEKVKLGTDAAVEDAFLSLQWSFRHHWGNHCIGALRCLHFLTYPGKKMRYRPAACDISGCNAYHRL